MSRTITLIAEQSTDIVNKALVSAVVSLNGRVTKQLMNGIEFAVGGTRGNAALSRTQEGHTSIRINTRFGHSIAAAVVAIVLFPIGVLIALAWWGRTMKKPNCVHEKLVTSVSKELGIPGNWVTKGNWVTGIQRNWVSPQSHPHPSAAVMQPIGAEKKYCIECGKPIPTDATYCTECGKRQVEETTGAEKAEVVTKFQKPFEKGVTASRIQRESSLNCPQCGNSMTLLDAKAQRYYCYKDDVVIPPPPATTRLKLQIHKEMRGMVNVYQGLATRFTLFFYHRQNRRSQHLRR
jgi:ribosomal protein L40E